VTQTLDGARQKTIWQMWDACVQALCADADAPLPLMGNEDSCSAREVQNNGSV
jgi:hypothetical protein